MKKDELQSTIDSALGAFREEFPAMGVSGDPKDNCIHRFDHYTNDKSDLETFLEQYIRQAWEAGQQNPKVGFLRQYLNEQDDGKGNWTDEMILDFLQIPFTSPPSK